MQSVGTSKRDDGWFDELFRTHATAVYRYFVRRVGAQEAHDLSADVFATAWRRRADIPDDAELPWLYRTAGFILANYRRKARPIPIGEVPDVADLGAGGVDPAVLGGLNSDVRTVLEALSARDRQILLLSAWEGLDGNQLAAVLGISRGGADAALSRARARLRDLWDAKVIA